jgi:polyisoprenyl-teichoic acid--peptidoglycan teichoic acid transferase
MAQPRSSTIAAFLSFLWPGLGHWYLGRRRAGLLFAIPAVLAVGALAIQAVGGVEQLAALLLSPSSALTILILMVLLGVWRLIAMVDSAYTRRQVRTRTTSAVVLSLGLVIILTHAWAGYVAWAFYSAGNKIFVAENGPDATEAPVASIVPGATEDPDSEYLATPLATPATVQDRINVLLTGVDSAETRTTALTDTLLVASIDPVTNDVALISFPRDISNFPLWDGRTFTGKINGFMTWANNHPKEFPDGGLPSLVKELGFLLGVPIHYFAAVDLAGFRKMIDAVGGVTIDNKRAINDPRYDWLDGRRGFRLSVGKHKLNGEKALAYVRSRYTPGDNDFNRAARQQEVLLALRKKLTSPEMLPKIPELVDVAGDTVRTNFPSERVSEMISIASKVDNAGVRQIVLGRPYAFHPDSSTTNGIYTLKLRMDRLKKLSVEIFGAASAYADEVSLASPSASPSP